MTMSESGNYHDGRVPVRDRERSYYRCPGCDAEISMAYIKPRGQKIHNRPLCERCRVPMERLLDRERDE